MRGCLSSEDRNLFSSPLNTDSLQLVRPLILKVTQLDIHGSLWGKDVDCMWHHCIVSNRLCRLLGFTYSGSIIAEV